MIKSSLLNLADPWTGFWLSVQALGFFIWLDPKTLFIVLSVVSIFMALYAVRKHALARGTGPEPSKLGG